MKCYICESEIDDWAYCPQCGFDLTAYEEFSVLLAKYEGQLTRRNRDWDKFNHKILNGFKSQDLGIIKTGQTLIENLIKSIGFYGSYSNIIIELHKKGKISSTENTYLGMLAIIRNTLVHGGKVKFDPIYFSVLLKALISCINFAVREKELIPVSYAFEEEYFVPPSCFDEILKNIENKGVVLLVGDPFIGKTTIAKKVSIDYIRKKYKVYFDDDIEDEIVLDSNTLVILDNCFGESKPDNDRIKKTLKILESQEKQKGEKFKILMTSRKDIFGVAKHKEVLKDSHVFDTISIIEIKPEDYSANYENLLFNLAKKNDAPENKIDEIAKYINEIKIELRTPGELERLIKIVEDFDGQNLSELIKKAKITDEWVNSILNQADKPAKYLVALLLLCGEIAVPIFKDLRDRKEEMLADFVKEVIRRTNPGVDPEVRDVFSYISHQISELRGILDMYYITRPEFYDWPGSELLKIFNPKFLLPARLGCRLPAFNKSEVLEKLIGGYIVNFYHYDVMESVEKYILENEPELLRNAFQILKEIYADKEQHLVIEALSKYPDILEDYLPYIFGRIDENIRLLKNKIPIQIFNGADLLSDISYSVIESSEGDKGINLVVEDKISNRVGIEIYRFVEDAREVFEIVLSTKLLESDVVLEFIYDNIENPLFNFILCEATASKLLSEETTRDEANKIIKIMLKALEYATPVAKKTIIASCFRCFWTLDDEVAEYLLDCLFEFPGYFIGEVYSSSMEGWRILLRLLEKRREIEEDTICSFVTYLLLNSMSKYYDSRFVYSINGLLYYNLETYDSPFSEEIVKHYAGDQLNSFFADNIIKFINGRYSEVFSTLLPILRILKLTDLTFSEDEIRDEFHEKFWIKGELLTNIFSDEKIQILSGAISKFVEKYGFDYHTANKLLQKDDTLLYAITTSELLSSELKQEILVNFLAENPGMFVQIALYFPNKLILSALIEYTANKEALLDVIYQLSAKLYDFTLKYLTSLKDPIYNGLKYYYNISEVEELHLQLYEDLRILYRPDLFGINKYEMDAKRQLSNKYKVDVISVYQIESIFSMIEGTIVKFITEFKPPSTSPKITELLDTLGDDLPSTEAQDKILAIKRYLNTLKNECGIDFYGPFINIDLKKVLTFIGIFS